MEVDGVVAAQPPPLRERVAVAIQRRVDQVDARDDTV